MLNANQTITHVYSVYDKNLRANVHKSEVLTGSWFRQTQVSIENKEVINADLVQVRIPIGDDVPKIKVTDYMILGDVDITGMTLSAMKKAYPESFEVRSVTYNTHSLTGYSNHIRVSGS